MFLKKQSVNSEEKSKKANSKELIEIRRKIFKKRLIESVKKGVKVNM